MFSKELELSIASLFDKAQEANIQYITVEHLLLMILNDFDVIEFFKCENINIDSLSNDLNEHLKNNVVSLYHHLNNMMYQKLLYLKNQLYHLFYHIEK